MSSAGTCFSRAPRPTSCWGSRTPGTLRSRRRRTRRTTLWLTWVGFNLSHSLGAVLFGAVVVLVGRSEASFQAQAGVFLPLANVVSVCYLAIGLRCWFRAPLLGIALAGVCFLTAWLAFALAG